MSEPNANTPPAAGASAAPAAQNQPAAATGIDPAQHHAAIEKARLEEREKLRTQIDKLQGQVEGLSTVKAENETLKAQVAKLTDELAAVKAGIKADGGVDLAKAIEQAVSAASARWNAEQGQIVADLNSRLEAAEKARAQLTLEQTREKLIAEAGGASVLIPEMVRGTSEDELRASIEASKAVFARTLAAAGVRAANSPASSNTAPVNGNPGAGNPPVVVQLPPASGSGAPANQNAGDVPANIRQMPLSDWAKVRESVKARVASRYKTANVVVSG